MRLHKTRPAGFYLAAHGAVLATSAGAAGRNRKTMATFGDLPEVPGPGVRLSVR